MADRSYCGSVAERTRRLHPCRACREGDRQQTSTVALLPQVADADSPVRSAVVGPSALRQTPPALGPTTVTRPRSLQGATMKGTRVACGGQPHAEDTTRAPSRLP